MNTSINTLQSTVESLGFTCGLRTRRTRIHNTHTSYSVENIFYTQFLMNHMLPADTNYGSQEGVVKNTVMANLTTIKRAVAVFAKKSNIQVTKVTCGALQAFMMKTTGKYDARPRTTYVFPTNMLHSQDLRRSPVSVGAMSTATCPCLTPYTQRLSNASVPWRG